MTKKCREKKDEQGISKNNSKIKRFISHTLFKNKQTREQKKIVGRKTTFFQIHHNKQAKNAKTGDLFSRNRKIRQNKKNKCKTCPKKKKTDNKVFFGEKRKTEKESLTKVYKDSKNCEERI